LAGLAVGYWESAEQIAAQWAAEKTFAPRMSAEERDSRYHGWQRAVERAKAWLNA
jgi:glycerol kinase